MFVNIVVNNPKRLVRYWIVCCIIKDVKGGIKMGKILIAMKIIDGKYESSFNCDQATLTDLSSAISYLEILKLQMIDNLKSLMVIQKEENVK